jgi:hypothetical protein
VAHDPFKSSIPEHCQKWIHNTKLDCSPFNESAPAHPLTFQTTDCNIAKRIPRMRTSWELTNTYFITPPLTR